MVTSTPAPHTVGSAYGSGPLLDPLAGYPTGSRRSTSPWLPPTSRCAASSSARSTANSTEPIRRTTIIDASRHRALPAPPERAHTPVRISPTSPLRRSWSEPPATRRQRRRRGPSPRARRRSQRPRCLRRSRSRPCRSRPRPHPALPRSPPTSTRNSPTKASPADRAQVQATPVAGELDDPPANVQSSPSARLSAHQDRENAGKVCRAKAPSHVFGAVSPAEWCRYRPSSLEGYGRGHRANLRSSYTTRFDTMAHLQSALSELADQLTGTDPTLTTAPGRDRRHRTAGVDRRRTVRSDRRRAGRAHTAADRAAQRAPAQAGVHAGRGCRGWDPQAVDRVVLSRVARAAPPDRQGVVGGDHARLHHRHLYQEGRRPGQSAGLRLGYLQVDGVADLQGHRRRRRRAAQPPPGSSAVRVRVARRHLRARPRARPGRVQSGRDRLPR